MALPLRGRDYDGLGKEANVMASQIHSNCVDVICSISYCKIPFRNNGMEFYMQCLLILQNVICKE